MVCKSSLFVKSFQNQFIPPMLVLKGVRGNKNSPPASATLYWGIGRKRVEK